MIIDRIRQIIDYKQISVRKFCIEIGVSNGFLDKVKDVGVEKVAKILYTYPEINPEWLVTGNGEMIKQQSSPKLPIDTSRIDELNEMIEMQRKLIKNLEAEVKRLEKELEKTQSFPSSRMAADDELNYEKKKR